MTSCMCILKLAGGPILAEAQPAILGKPVEFDVSIPMCRSVLFTVMATIKADDGVLLR